MQSKKCTNLRLSLPSSPSSSFNNSRNIQISSILHSSTNSPVSTPHTQSKGNHCRVYSSAAKKTPDITTLSIRSNTSSINLLMKAQNEKKQPFLKTTGISHLLDPFSKFQKNNSKELYEALGLLNDKNLAQESKTLRSNSKSTIGFNQKVDLGAPSSRKDVEILAE